MTALAVRKRISSDIGSALKSPHRIGWHRGRRVATTSDGIVDEQHLLHSVGGLRRHRLQVGAIDVESRGAHVHQLERHPGRQRRRGASSGVGALLVTADRQVHHLDRVRTAIG